MITENKKLFRITVAVIDVLVVLAFFFLEGIAEFMIAYFPECFYYSVLGVECPTCGATRCVFYFFGGDLKSAFMMNQFIFLVIIYVIVLFVLLNLALFNLKFAEKAVNAMTSFKAGIAFAICFFVFAVLRMFGI